MDYFYTCQKNPYSYSMVLFLEKGHFLLEFIYKNVRNIYNTCTNIYNLVLISVIKFVETSPQVRNHCFPITALISLHVYYGIEHDQ